VQVFVCKQCNSEFCENCIAEDRCPACSFPERTEPGRAYWKFSKIEHDGSQANSKRMTEKARANAFLDEMRLIGDLFSVPVPGHPEYQKRILERAEAEQACRRKYGEE
jgi:hypothetical protein